MDEEMKGTRESSTPAECLLMELLASAQGAAHPVDTLEEVAPEVAYMRLLLVNACFLGPAGAPSGGWTLVDTGLPGSARYIRKAAAQRFGGESRPQSIIITHGHFDHVGSITDLLTAWGDVPVYAHAAEIPYLTGTQRYLEPEPGVDWGMMAKMSPLFPNEPIKLDGHVQPLPADGRIPGLPAWRWVDSHGHTPGHIALFRERDRVLIIGDAFTTTDQESVMAVMTRQPEVHGPPKYFTPDWGAAKAAVAQLAALRPALVIPSHGKPMRGEELTRQLDALVTNFDDVAVPKYGRRAA